MVLGTSKLSVPGRPAGLNDSRAGVLRSFGRNEGDCWIFFLSSFNSLFLSPSLWEMARYRLKYCLKGPLNPNQPTILHLLCEMYLKT